MNKKRERENINSLLARKAPELSFEESVFGDFISDKNANIQIHTFPILEYEERYISINESVSYTYFSLYYYGKCSEVVRVRSTALFNSNTYIEKFGNKPFVGFNQESWDMFFELIFLMLEEIEQREIYQYSGWNSTLDQYIFGNIRIEADELCRIQTNQVKKDTLLSEINKEEIVKIINKIAENLSRGKPLAGYTMLMYLIMGHLEPRFVERFIKSFEFALSVVGMTGTGKTSTLKAIFNTCDLSVLSFEDT